ncbi:MAG: DUF4097 domain-containing protein [Lachnospiraceae bacterium]|nr:DUF4097 domain-containing protein [Lachnospiraceae bacterium]
MKHISKIILIITAICVSLGLLITIVAVAAGGAGIAKEIVLGKHFPSLYVNTNRANDEFGIYFGNVSTKENSVGWSAETIKNLDLKYEAGLVEIVEGDDDVTVKVIYRGKNSVSLEGDKLIINSTNKEIINGKGTVRLEVPKGFAFDNVKMQVGAAQVDIGMLRAKNFELELGAGAACIDNIACDNMNIHIAAGEVFLEDAHVENAYVDVGMGNLEYEGIVSKDLDVNCGMGNVFFEIKDREEIQNNYKVECGAGNVTVGDSSYSGLATVRNITNENASADYVLKCGMGNIEIAFE